MFVGLFKDFLSLYTMTIKAYQSMNITPELNCKAHLNSVELSRTENSDEPQARVLLAIRSTWRNGLKFGEKIVFTYILSFLVFLVILERFSIERRKTKPKTITMANHSKRKQRNEPMRTKYTYPVPSAGKRM